MTDILYGKPVVDELEKDLRKRIECLSKSGIVPAVAIIRVGKSESDISYEKSIIKRAQMLGIKANVFVYEQDVSAEELIKKINTLNVDPCTHGIMLFRPLTGGLKLFERDIVDAISPEKDIDGATKLSLAGVMLNEKKVFSPCTPEACISILNYYDIDVNGKKVAIIGRSAVVGKPLALMLTNLNATVTLCHSNTLEIEKIANESDIIITAAGRLGLVQKCFVHPGQTVIDVSVNYDPMTGKMKGDVSPDAAEIVSAITPVPGGVGAVTTMILMRHIVMAAVES